MIINTYKELHEYVNAFSKGKLNLLIIVGKGGVGKTQKVQKSLKHIEHGFISGHSTPLSLYYSLYDFRNKLVVLDDTDSMSNNKTTLGLLKQLCDTIPVKQVSFSTTKKLDIPSVFTTSSKVIMLCNEGFINNPHIQAVLTRGIVIHFIPDKKEIYNELLSFAKDKTILKFIDKAKDTLNSGSMNFRVYKQAVMLRNSGLDWQNFLKQELKLDNSVTIARAITESGLPYSDRVTLWEQQTGLSRRTYDNLLIEIGKNR